MRILVKSVMVFVILCATRSVYGQSCSGMSLGDNANLNGFVPFPSTNVWNTNIASAPVDPNSAAITSAAGFAGLYLHPDFGSESTYGIPYVVVDSTITPSVPINVIDYAAQSDVVVAPYPATAPIEGYPADCSGWPDTYNGDAHVLVLDRAKCELYETFNTNRCNGSYDASSETIWDMENYESRPWGWTSADAAGLPIFPGLVRYDEIASGEIKHAIRFTMEHTKDDANGGYFVYPASHAAGNIWGVSNVMGMRIRLKASFDISGFSTVNQVILTAMKQYGMILADNGGYFFFQGASDPRFDDNDLDNLKNVASSNFEVVQATPEFPGYDSETAPTGALPQINSFTASELSVNSGSAVTLSYSITGDSYDFIDMIGPVASGSREVTIYPTATHTYTLNSTNAFGRTTSKSITVSVLGSVVAAPVFDPPAGVYNSAQTVTIRTPTSPAATIYYATNGTTPTTKSAAFSISNPIIVSSSETLKAIATVTGYTAASAVGTAAYTIGAPAAAVPVFSLASGSYSTAKSVMINDATAGAVIYFTTNGLAPTSSSTKYNGAITVSATTTIKAIAVAANYTNSPVATATYTISMPVAATPVFSVKAGTYPAAQSITLSDATAGAVIYFTTNGVAPTSNSTKYTGAITVSTITSIKAIAVAANYTDSPVGTATYIIIGSPSALAFPATALSTSGAALNAVVNGFGFSGLYHFQYGTSSTALTSSTATTALRASTTSVAARAQLTGLKTKTTYYYRVAVTTAGGTATGAVMSLTTN